MQARQLHRPLDLFVAHEPTPDIFGHQIFSAQEYNTYVDSNYVRIGPASVGIKRIGKSVPAIDARTRCLIHGTQGLRGELGSDDNRIYKIVDAGRLGFAAAAVIDPGVGILIGEEWCTTEKRVVFIVIPVSFPRVPRFGFDWMCRRTDSKQIKHRMLAVIVPAGLNEAALRTPAHGQQRRIAVEHPRIIYSFVNSRRVSVYLRVAAIVLSC